MKMTRVAPEARCPKCSSSLTGASDPFGDDTPSPDDLSVCAYCGELLVFNHDMTVRTATGADVAKLEPLEALHFGQVVGLVRLHLKKERDGNH